MLLPRLLRATKRRLKAVKNAAQRAWLIYRGRGASSLMVVAGRNLTRRIGAPVGRHHEYLRHKAEVDRHFDAERGVNTEGVQNLFDFTIVGSNLSHGVSHVAADPSDFAEGLATLSIEPSGFSFVDLGSGKGRALLLAADAGFSAVIGVEFALELHEIAIANIRAFAVQKPVLAARIKVVHADAISFSLPRTPLVVFLFNPFDAVVCRQVASNILESWNAFPRPIHVFYMNPIEFNTWIEAGWRLTKRARPYALLEPRDQSEKGDT